MQDEVEQIGTSYEEFRCIPRAKEKFKDLWRVDYLRFWVISSEYNNL